MTDCGQEQLFELPKYMPPRDQRAINDPIEQWLYFSCRVEELAAEAMTARLPDPDFAEAAGVLEMIARNPDERRLYNGRLKLEHRAAKLAEAPAPSAAGNLPLDIQIDQRSDPPRLAPSSWSRSIRGEIVPSPRGPKAGG